MNRYIGNLPPMPGAFPDYPAPVVRNVGADRELTTIRCGHAAATRGRLVELAKASKSLEEAARIVKRRNPVGADGDLI